MHTMSFSQLARNLFETQTIAPSYTKPHILYTLLLLGTEQNGIGRYKIKQEIGLGEGSMKTLLKRLKEENIVTVDGSKQRGHSLTITGQRLFDHINQIIRFPEEISNSSDHYVIGDVAYYTVILPQFVLDSYSSIRIRDEAIKIGGAGCSTLLFNGSEWIFPDTSGYKTGLHLDQESTLPKNTLIVIGGGESKEKAILATLAAVLLVVKEL